MQCRDEGLLDLDDRLGDHVAVPVFGDLTIRRLLSHTAGIQREPHGDAWAAVEAPGLAELLAGLDRSEQVLAPGRRYHYSNLAFGLLGNMVAGLRGGTWAELVADRITGPLGLGSVTAVATPSAAVGFVVDDYSDYARPEPPVRLGALAPAGELWGAAADLAKWAGYLADPATVDPGGTVLAQSTLDEMRWPHATTEDASWGAGFGLGLLLMPQGNRVTHVGHDGAMPGFLASAYGRRGGAGLPAALGAAVLASTGNGFGIRQIVHPLLAAVVEHDPADITPWRMGEPAPEAYRPLLGLWWIEGSAATFSWHDGRLRAGDPGDPADVPDVFAPVDGEPDLLRVVSGPDTGELLRLIRDPAGGEVTQMRLATYRVTRTQENFEGRSASGR